MSPRELEIGDLVQVYGCSDNHIPSKKPLDDTFEVLEVHNDGLVAVQSKKDKSKMRVHKSRIVPNVD